MERIKEALERARSERGTAAVAPARGSTRAAGDTPEPDASRITYSQTRSLAADPAGLEARRVLLGDRDDAASRGYKLLRTQVLQRMVANGWNALAVTSPRTGQGATLTAVNLAISLAREVNYTVLLVDLNLRAPGLHRCFGFEPRHGLGDYLAGDVPLNAILVHPGIDRLVLLPASRTTPGSSETLASARMREVVAELKGRYPARFVLFDLPPVLSADDALAFSPYVDAVLLVVEEGGTARDDVAGALDLLAGIPVIGTVLNRAREVAGR